MPTLYRGRFAPSPTGPLHLGSLLAALGSYLQAKRKNGKWLVRIEDLDPPREVAGAAKDILNTLEAFGLLWDEEVIYQSQQHKHYHTALAQLRPGHHIYPCSCSRKTIQENTVAGKIGPVYPGFCRQGVLKTKASYSQRLRSSETTIAFVDQLHGTISQSLCVEIGDIVLQRADGLFAYHLAVVVDDYLQGITEVVRGRDLIDCTPIQIYLQQCLGYNTPDYIHLPIIVNKNSEKLSKQTGAMAIDINQVETTLITLLTMLDQAPPSELADANKQEILSWAETNWAVNSCTTQNIFSPGIQITNLF